MNPKRTMNQALRAVDLGAEAAAFVAAGAPGVTTRTASGPASAPDAVVRPGELARPSEDVAPPSLTPPFRHSPPPAQRRAPVSMTFRLPAELPAALLRVAMERKLRGDQPCTQQDIVGEAVREWLERHGGEG